MPLVSTCAHHCAGSGVLARYQTPLTYIGGSAPAFAGSAGTELGAPVPRPSRAARSKPKLWWFGRGGTAAKGPGLWVDG